jgi:hypothetical protein
LSGPNSVPVGRFTLPRPIASATSSIDRLRAASWRGSTSTRTANFCAPKIPTCATPSIIEMRCAMLISAYSLMSESGSVAELSVRNRMGESEGLTFCSDGGAGMSFGSDRFDREMAPWTSCAAASMSRSRSNCSVMLVLPSEFVELIELMPATVANCFSSGVATAAAMVSGVAPGRLALTEMVGKSMLGRSLTGRER